MPRAPRVCLSVGRLLLAVAALSVVCAVMSRYQVPTEAALLVVTACAACFLAVALLARDTRDLCSALAAVLAGILVAAPMIQDSCTAPGILIYGPIVGWIVRVVTRPPQRVASDVI